MESQVLRMAYLIIKNNSSAIISAISALTGSYIGIRYGIRQIRLQRSLDFYEKQLREFYSPMLGCRKEIRAKR